MRSIALNGMLKSDNLINTHSCLQIYPISLFLPITTKYVLLPMSLGENDGVEVHPLGYEKLAQKNTISSKFSGGNSFLGGGGGGGGGEGHP